MDTFEQTRKFFGNEINREYLLALERKLRGMDSARIELKNEDFFQLNWENILTRLPQPILLLGNPPWVTNRVWDAFGDRICLLRAIFRDTKGSMQ